MLPQMMPLPWLFIFFCIFFCFYSFLFYISFYLKSCTSSSSLVNASKISILW